jgi:hypothetical protein
MGTSGLLKRFELGKGVYWAKLGEGTSRNGNLHGICLDVSLSLMFSWFVKELTISIHA